MHRIPATIWGAGWSREKMGAKANRVSSTASAVWHALTKHLSGQADAVSLPAAEAAARAIERLVSQEQDNRRFLEQIARHEPLPNILKHLVDMLERQNPALHGCFVLCREGRVCY